MPAQTSQNPVSKPMKAMEFSGHPTAITMESNPFPAARRLQCECETVAQICNVNPRQRAGRPSWSRPGSTG
jgi:hypothetical protein